MGADVAVLDRNPEAQAVLGNRVRTLFSTCDVVELLSPRADLVIATVLVPGSTAPKIDHGANGEGGENRRDGELRDDIERPIHG